MSEPVASKQWSTASLEAGVAHVAGDIEMEKLGQEELELMQQLQDSI